MSPARAASRQSETTTERILNAAVLRFSRHSYETTGLRDIAADVGVDVAYVHRCFGSKEKLFREALRVASRPSRFFAGGARDLATLLVTDLLRSYEPDEVRPLDMVIRSFASPEASATLHEMAAVDFIEPFVATFEGTSSRQAALVMAFVAGIGIAREVMRAEPLLEGTGGALEEEILDILKKIMEPKC